MQFDLVTPEKLIVSKEVDYVEASGQEGHFGVLNGHSPLISATNPGPLHVRVGEDVVTYFVGYGFVDVTPTGVTVLAEEAALVADLDAEKIAKDLTEATTAVADLEKSGSTGVALETAIKRQQSLQAQQALLVN